MVYLSIIGLLICNAYGRSIIDQGNTVISNNNFDVGYDRKEYVEVKINVKKLGSVIQLECEANGTPPPSIQWVHGNEPIENVNIFNLIFLLYLTSIECFYLIFNNLVFQPLLYFQIEDLSSSKLDGSDSTALVRVRSRIVIQNDLTSERTFTCVGRSGSKVSLARTTIYPEPANNNSELWLTGRKNRFIQLNKARIVFYYANVVEFMGQNVVLPCEVSGRPRPEITWFFNDVHVADQNPRFKVQEDGALFIESLNWDDFGIYKCVAKNRFSRDEVSTTLLPVVSF